MFLMQINARKSHIMMSYSKPHEHGQRLIKRQSQKKFKLGLKLKRQGKIILEEEEKKRTPHICNERTNNKAPSI